MTQEETTVTHCEYESTRPFDQVVAAFKASLGAWDGEALRKAVEASKATDDFAARMRAAAGPSGFMQLMEIDHGAWMARFGLKGRAVAFAVGNPSLGKPVIEHDIRVGLHMPLRVLIYEDPASGTCRLSYDQPSSLTKRLKNDRLTAAAKHLDQKLAALAEMAIGAPGNR